MSAVEELIQTGLAHQQAGRLGKAEIIYRKVLEHVPNNPHALHLLGVLAHQAGENEQALELISAAISRRPDIADFHSNLGIALRELGRLPEAEQSHRQALRLKPDFAEALNNLGVVLTDQNNQKSAETALREAIRLSPSYSEAWNNLGITLKTQDRNSEAEAAYRESLRLNPDFSEVWNNLGLSLRAQDQYHGALTAFRESLHRQPDYAAALFHIGLAKHFEDVEDDDAKTMRTLLQDAGLKPEHRALLLFALGKIHDECGDYRQAFDHFRRGNRSKRGMIQYNAEDNADKVQRIMTTFNNDFFTRWTEYGSQSELPLFIVGLPRSGKTLIEQILTGHPCIHGAGELLTLPSQIIGELVTRNRSGKSFPECVLDMDGALATELALIYKQRLQRDIGTSIERVIDTLPTNFFRLGIIALLFPNARVIHCQRDPLDICLAIYCKYFRRGNGYAYDFADIAAYYRTYAQLMEHWRAVLPLQMLEIEYEALVTDPQRETRRMIDYCSLEWDPRCLLFNDSPAPPGSRKQPLHNRWVSHWRHYEEFLDPLREALEQL